MKTSRRWQRRQRGVRLTTKMKRSWSTPSRRRSSRSRYYTAAAVAAATSAAAVAVASTSKRRPPPLPAIKVIVPSVPAVALTSKQRAPTPPAVDVIVPSPPCTSFIQWERMSCYIDSFFVCIFMGNNALLNKIIRHSTPSFAGALLDVVHRLSSPSLSFSCPLITLRTLIHQGPFTGIFDVGELIEKINRNAILPNSPFQIQMYPKADASSFDVPDDTHVFFLVLDSKKYYHDLIVNLLTGGCFNAFSDVLEKPDKEDESKLILRKMCTYLWSTDKTSTYTTRHVYGIIVFIRRIHYVCYYICEVSGVWWFYDGLNPVTCGPLRPAGTNTLPTIFDVLDHFNSLPSDRDKRIAYILVK
jgi:hypothetical protein